VGAGAGLAGCQVGAGVWTRSGGWLAGRSKATTSAPRCSIAKVRSHWQDRFRGCGGLEVDATQVGIDAGAQVPFTALDAVAGNVGGVVEVADFKSSMKPRCGKEAGTIHGFISLRWLVLNKRNTAHRT